MTEIFVNLKRFDVPRDMGGVCNYQNPKEWIEWIIETSIQKGLGTLQTIEVTFLIPEGLIMCAHEKLSSFPAETIKNIHIGCQGIYREDVTKGGNFGAFTTNRPAAAVRNLGCTWTIIGHSEEVKDKLEIMAHYDPEVLQDPEKRNRAKGAIHSIIRHEVLCALRANLNVLLCLGETAEERGSGTSEEQRGNVKKVLRRQVEETLQDFKADDITNNLVLAYEPLWAIGPGKTPPEPDYIEFVASYIKEVFKERYGSEVTVVYGGGLKEENAASIAQVKAIGGGLVALTQFKGEIGFYPDDLVKIIKNYESAN
ncbi:triose-phosphate isomerase [Desulfosporosinus sp. FKA]|uniref:triose-phosphate isomerase family protein n=1 Tax=Desulfosporosinus sp. FKA TaxID=1969834 RepID=UPI000B498DD4|nr:triose-phosphate isomerase [Desulfosporosinus sp. FKA]